MMLESGNLDPRESSATTIADAIGFIRRRFVLCLLIALPIVAAAVLLAFRLSAVYESQATILIEQPAIPDDIVSSTISSYVDEQIQVVAQRVFTPDSVGAIIDKFDLYPKAKKSVPRTQLVEQFITDTEVVNLTADVTDNRGRPSQTTFAFTIGFRYTDPILAQQVTAELSDRFLDENLRSRKERAATTTAFLEQEAKRLASEISDTERRIADFKDKHADALPDEVRHSSDVLTRTETDITQTEDSLRQLREDQHSIQAQLSTLDPYAAVFNEQGQPVYSAEQRLEELRRQYLELSSRYGPEHPDVKRTKREIDALMQGDGTDSPVSVERQRAVLETERDALLERYSPEYPDVVRLQKQIDALPAPDPTASQKSLTKAPTNPEYLQAQGRLEIVNSGIDAAQKRLKELTDRRDSLEKSITVAPRVEQEWLQLNRGYDALRQEYEDIKRRSTAARLSENLEAQNIGERFSLVNRANLPSSPVEPNRPGIIFLGCVVALGAAIGIAALVDAMDTTVRGERDLKIDIGAKPIGIVPYMQTAQEVRMIWMRRAAASGALVALVMLVLFLT